MENKEQYFKNLLKEVQPQPSLSINFRDKIIQRVSDIDIQTEKVKSDEYSLLIFIFILISCGVSYYLSFNSNDIQTVLIENIREVSHQLVTFFYTVNIASKILPILAIMGIATYFFIDYKLEYNKY